MRRAGITGILRLPSALRAGAAGVIAKALMAAAIAAATLTAAPVTPASPEYDAVIAQALTLPVRDALRALDSLSRVQSAPGWFKAKSLKLLGDHQFIKADYKKAADFYLQASKYDNTSMYRHLYALSLAANGQTAQAVEIWSAIAGDAADPISGEASSLLQQMALTGHTPVSYAPQTGLTGQPPVPYTPPPAPPLVLPDAGRVDNSSTATSQFQQTAPTTTAPVQQSTAGSPQNSGIFYTVQVGAFGAVENAENLSKKLSGTYSDVIISPTASGGQTLYRVRIGTFQTREEAAAFADKLITTAGLSAKVFEK